MARRSKRKSRRGNSNTPMLLIVGAVVVLVVVAGALALKPSQREQTPAHEQGQSFSVEDYRRDASRFTGNVYRIEGRVEHIETLGNDRIVAVAVPGNRQERLPLLVRSGAAGRVNLTRGDSFLFEVECCTGHTDDQREVKGVLVVRQVETK